MIHHSCRRDEIHIGGPSFDLKTDFRAGECNLSISSRHKCQCFGCDIIKKECLFTCECVSF